jgi:Fic family protein
MSLHLILHPDPNVADRLHAWDEAVRASRDMERTDWRLLVVWPAARDASVSGSTGIEGNPLRPDQVEQVLAGATVAEDPIHVREVENYNRALNLARDAALRPDFDWSNDFIHLINAAVMEGLPRDTHGNYRSSEAEEVHVGVFRGPSPLVVQGLMDELVAWLCASRSTPLVRAALLHLNIIAIHPFNDGNGRTARILASVELVRDGVRAPELISIEAYLRRNRDEYIEMLRTTLGESYDPHNHSATPWLDYYTRISLDRLTVRNRVVDAVPTDVGVIFAALADRGDPVSWAPALLAARVSRLRTAHLAEMTQRSLPAARAELGRMVRAGWLAPTGRTRGRWYAPTNQLDELRLRVPELMRRMADGEQLSMFDEGPS